MVCIISCSGEIIQVNLYGGNNPIQCKSCNETLCIGCYDVIRQKRIWNQVRVPSSQLISVLKVQNVIGGESNKPTLANANVNWNQSSDRAIPAIQKVYRPTNGNSTKTSITRERPGSQSPGGVGVDIKHNSYERYLMRKKGKHLNTESNSSSPLIGNKTKSFGFFDGCIKC